MNSQENNFTLTVKIAREELDNVLENIYFSGYYLQLKKPQSYYQLLLRIVNKIETLSQYRLSYSSLELRLKIEKLVYETIDYFLEENNCFEKSLTEKLITFSVNSDWIAIGN